MLKMESNFEKKESYTDEQVDALMSYYEESDKRYKDPTPEEEKALGRLVIEILNETISYHRHDFGESRCEIKTTR